MDSESLATKVRRPQIGCPSIASLLLLLQSSAGNPPWMLPCGHVICKQSVLKIAKAATRPFKCPYCPQEATPGQCKEIIFPDME